MKAGTVMNLLSATNNTGSSLFETRTDPLNTNQTESNLCIDEWMNHNEVYAAVEAGLNNEKDLAPITILCCETIQGQYCNRHLLS